MITTVDNGNRASSQVFSTREDFEEYIYSHTMSMIIDQDVVLKKSPHKIDRKALLEATQNQCSKFGYLSLCIVGLTKQEISQAIQSSYFEYFQITSSNT